MSLDKEILDILTVLKDRSLEKDIDIGDLEEFFHRGVGNLVIDRRNGIKYWYKDGKLLHREDGPAVEYADGSKEWYKNGKLHRDDGPAIECVNGDKSWYKNGKCHRDNGPAIEFADGAKEWLKNGQLHREDGPAIDYVHDRRWFKNGVEFNPSPLKGIKK